MKNSKNTGGKSPDYLPRFIPIALAYLDGNRTHAQLRFRSLIETGGTRVMEAVAGSDARLKYKLVAARLALEETGRNDLLHDAIGILSLVSIDRHGRLINASEPLALHLTALLRWEKGMGQVVKGPAPAPFAARIRDEQPGLIADIVAQQPETTALFPGFAPRAAFQPAAAAMTDVDLAATPAPVQRISITVNGKMSKTVEPSHPIRIYRRLADLQEAVSGLLAYVPQPQSDVLAKAREAIELIDVHAGLGITNDKIRKSKGIAFMKVGLYEEGIAYLESLMTPKGGHGRDKFIAVLYCKMLSQVGRDAEVIERLAPRLAKGGDMQRDAHAQLVFTLALGKTRGGDEALARLDALAAPDSEIDFSPPPANREYLSVKSRIAAMAPRVAAPAAATL